MAKIIKLTTTQKSVKAKATPLQQMLLKGPVMTEKQYKEYLKNNKWMRKWKA